MVDNSSYRSAFFYMAHVVALGGAFSGALARSFEAQRTALEISTIALSLTAAFGMCALSYVCRLSSQEISEEIARREKQRSMEETAVCVDRAEATAQLKLLSNAMATYNSTAPVTPEYSVQNHGTDAARDSIDRKFSRRTQDFNRFRHCITAPKAEWTISFCAIGALFGSMLFQAAGGSYDASNLRSFSSTFVPLVAMISLAISDFRHYFRGSTYCYSERTLTRNSK